MSDETTRDDEDVVPEEEAAPKRSRLPLVIALTVGIAIGGMAGSLIVGPLMAEGEETCDCAAGAETATDEHGEAVAGPAKPTYTVNDLVLNPAQSGGTRYLVLTIAFSVRDSALVQQMTDRDPEVRDILLKVLGAKTVGELTDVAGRPALKEEVRTQVGTLFGEKTIEDVFFPQYVVQ